MPTVTLATLVTCRSALVGRLMVLVAVLLAVLGSAVVLVMLTALVIEPAPALTCTVRVNVPLAPLARLALVTVSAPLLVLKLPVLACALNSVRPAAVRLAASVTLAAVLGPAWLKVMT